MKKFFVVLLSLTLLLSVGLFTACAGTPANLSLNKTSATIEKYSSTLLVATYDGEETLSWSSSNTSVATVSNGSVLAVGEGSATITVTDGDVSATCAITVNAPDTEKFGLKVVEQGASAELTSLNMYLSDSKTVVSTVTYNNAPIAGATVTYATEATNVAISDAGVITASAIGQATITASCTIDGASLSKQFTVNVVVDAAIVIQQTNVELFPIAEYDDETYDNTITCTTEVTVRNEVITPEAGTIAWSVEGATDVISVNADGLVTALNVGEATLVATYTPAGGTSVRAELVITVSPVSIDVEDGLVEVGKTTKYVPDLNALVGSDEEATKIILNSVDAENVEILPDQDGFSFADYTSGDATITIVTRNFAYTFNAVIYDAVIASVDDFKVLLTATNGFFKVVADIDMADYTDNGGVWTNTNATTFRGTIEGDEHIIKNFKTSSGIFNLFNGTIKNLALVDVHATTNCGIISNGYMRTGVANALVENVYVSLKTSDANWYVGMFNNINPGSTVTIKDTIMVDKTAEFNDSCFFGKFGSVAMSLENAYLIGCTEFMYGLNTNLSRQDQEALYLPAAVREQYKLYTSLGAGFAAYLGGEILLSDWIDSVLEEDLNIAGSEDITLITAENVTDLLNATSGTFIITEDIDMATAYTDNGGVWASTSSFNGSINGLNHTISNFKTSTGLFNQLGSGAGLVEIKNLAFVDAQVTGQVGTLAKTVAVGNLTINIDSVFISHSTAPSWGGGGILGRSPRLGSGGTTMNITNTVICINGTDGASYGLVAHTFNDTYGLTFSNCYFAGANGTVVNTANVAIPTTGYTAYTDIAALKVALGASQVTGLSAFLVRSIQNLA